jgi:hypothetical protein
MFTIKLTALNDTMRKNGDALMGEHLLVTQRIVYLGALSIESMASVQ